ncbi:MAG TPA: DUF1566 domain-containing protein [Polyangiaceae bacterium]|nr:DUF1566 domain-containing protein [Polyangiaceae bacterium]
MRRFAAPLALAVVCTFTVLARAVGAPTDQYQVFNKDSQYIRDLKTGLYWLRQPSTKGNYSSAESYCGGATVLGLKYRLPTYKELLTLVDEDPHLEYDPSSGTNTLRYIDPNAFPATPADVFWTLSQQTDGKAKVVSFGDGQTAARDPSSTGDFAYALCVH